MRFRASREIRAKIKGMQLSCVQAKNIMVKPSAADFEAELNKLQTFLAYKFSELKPAEDPVVSAVRRMYRRVGWEPTRYRPSSEALIRRLLSGKGLYRISNLVDYGNLASAFSHLPLGLYDTKKIYGLVILDVGRADETYRGIRKEVIHATGKLILRDEQGIFGNPTADSLRTAITANTQNILAVFFGPPEVKAEYLQKAAERLAHYYGPFIPASGEIRIELLQNL